MKKLSMLVATGLAVAMLTLLAACEKPAPPTQTAAVSPSRLGHAGRWLTDDKGRAVILRGFNMVNKFPPFTLSAIGFGEEDAALLAKEGFNAVRVGVIYSAVEPRPGEYDERYLEDIERTVTLLARHGILSLVDFHQDLYGPVLNGEGLPEWATLLDGMEPGPSKGFPFDYFRAAGGGAGLRQFLAEQARPRRRRPAGPLRRRLAPRRDAVPQRPERHGL